MDGRITQDDIDTRRRAIELGAPGLERLTEVPTRATHRGSRRGYVEYCASEVATAEDIHARWVHRKLKGPKPPVDQLGALISDRDPGRSPNPNRLPELERRADTLARRFAVLAERHGHSGALELAAAIAGLPTARRKRAA